MLWLALIVLYYVCKRKRFVQKFPWSDFGSDRFRHRFGQSLEVPVSCGDQRWRRIHHHLPCVHRVPLHAYHGGRVCDRKKKPGQCFRGFQETFLWQRMEAHGSTGCAYLHHPAFILRGCRRLDHRLFRKIAEDGVHSADRLCRRVQQHGFIHWRDTFLYGFVSGNQRGGDPCRSEERNRAHQQISYEHAGCADSFDCRLFAYPSGSKTGSGLFVQAGLFQGQF